MKNKKIGEILLEVEFITKEQLNAALLHQKKTDPKKKLGEILVELGFLNEADLLRCLAGLFRVRYISSEKLSKITIPRWVLDLIPLEFAEKHNVLPFFAYDKTKILSVVIPDPQGTALPKLVKNVSGYYEAELYLALESTIKAGIAKHYKNDHTAFERLKGLAKAGSPYAIASFVPKHQQVIDSEYNESAEATLRREEPWNRTLPPVIPRGVEPGISSGDQKKRLADEITSLSLLSDDTFIEVLNIVINVLERYKGEKYKGHSASVAKMVKAISRNIGLKAKETYYNVLGAYLHDCCMHAPEHLTLLHFNAADGSDLLRKYSKSPERLFEKARLPEEVQNILLHTFERYDGEGYPDGLKGKAIPLGSLIIATVDAFIHLMQFEKKVDAMNRYRSSFNTLRAFESRFFDPEVVAVLEDSIVDLFTDETSPRIIIIGNDLKELDTLAVKLKRNGILPYPLPGTEEVVNILNLAPVSLIISEVNTKPLDGFSLCNVIKSKEEYKDIHFIFLAEVHDSATISKGFDAGADDFIPKPYNPDLLIAKIQSLIKHAPQKIEKTVEAITQKKGLTGNLAEIQLTDLIQMLSSGKNSGSLKLIKSGESGEIFFHRGNIIRARYRHLEGVEAFNLLIRWRHGNFILDPDAELPEQDIFDSTEGLLMEAYRIWDEERGNNKNSG